MTVFSTDTPYSQYTGTGSQTYFEYGFDFAGQPVIVEVDGVPVTFTEQANGVVLDTAPVLGAVIVIYRQTPITQERDFTAFDGFHADWTEAALDKLILLKQEAAAWRAQTNLVAYQPVWYTDILSTAGTDPRIYLWNEGFAGVFAGEVTTQMPNAGAYVEKPEDFVYFQYGDIPIFTELLTTTLYPIEAEEKLAFTIDVDGGSMTLIDEDEMDMGVDFLSGTKITTLLTAPEQEDEMDVGVAFLSGTKAVTLIVAPTQEDEMDMGATFLSGSKELKLVTTYCPDEKLTFTIDVDAANCSMTPV